ncbi:MAG: uncharacterized protein QOF78_1654 [Phycisphaerales bacterium]|nr:uncharacterized protein [Phycisphaerales bacterium]
MSDLHLGRPWTDPVAAEIVHAAQATQPDALLLGGDLVDTARGLDGLAAMIAPLSQMCPVYAIEGNHDRRVGVARVRTAVESAGGAWLHSARLGQIRLEIEPQAAHDNAPRVLVAHDPRLFDRAADAGFNVVLAGHLHGGQCVLMTRRNLLYPGAFFARYTGLRFARNRTTMFVSRGAADTLPLRFNCPREVILCSLS